MCIGTDQDLQDGVELLLALLLYFATEPSQKTRAFYWRRKRQHLEPRMSTREPRPQAFNIAEAVIQVTEKEQ